MLRASLLLAVFCALDALVLAVPALACVRLALYAGETAAPYVLMGLPFAFLPALWLSLRLSAPLWEVLVPAAEAWDGEAEILAAATVEPALAARPAWHGRRRMLVA